MFRHTHMPPVLQGSAEGSKSAQHTSCLVPTLILRHNTAPFKKKIERQNPIRKNVVTYFSVFFGRYYILFFFGRATRIPKNRPKICRTLVQVGPFEPGEFWRSGLAERSRYAGGWWLEGERNLAGAARWCPSSLAKLVQISPISLWFMADITIVFMGFIKPLITGGHHPVGCWWMLCLVVAELAGKNFQSQRNGDLFLKCLVVSNINGLPSGNLT